MIPRKKYCSENFYSQPTTEQISISIEEIQYSHWHHNITFLLLRGPRISSKRDHAKNSWSRRNSYVESTYIVHFAPMSSLPDQDNLSIIQDP